MNPEITFTIPIRFLRAVALFTSSDPIREVLGGANVEITPTQTLLIGTDRRRLLAINVTSDAAMERPAQDFSFIIPNSLLSSLPKEEARNSGLRITYGDRGGVKTVSIAGAREVSAKAIEGNFPKWKDVVPRTPVKPIGSLFVNGRFLDSFSKANEALGSRSIGISVTQHEASGGMTDGPIAIYPMDISQNWFGVLMPMRSQDQQMPKWATE